MAIFRKPIAIILTITPLLIFSNAIVAQSPLPMKWGKIEKTDLETKTYPQDSSANAIVLCEYGQLFFYPPPQETHPDPMVEKIVHRRIKILNTAALDLANLSIPLRKRENFREYISEIKIQSFNLDENGKIQISTAKNSDSHMVDLGEYYRELRVACPNVKVGSIVEYYYRIKTDFNLSLVDWSFENILPTLHSEYRVNIHETFKVNVIQRGVRLQQKYGNTPTNIWALDSMPALTKEPHSASPTDYTDRVILQTAGVKDYSDQEETDEKGYTSHYRTWEELSKNLMEESYNDYSKLGYTFKNTVDSIITGVNTQEEKIERIHSYIVSHFKWDDHYAFTPTEFSTLLETHSGNSCALNLLMNIMLQQAGFESNPAILKLKRDGKISRQYPVLKEFGHMTVVVELEGRKMFVDCTNKYRPYDLPDINIINTSALIVKSGAATWAEITPSIKTKQKEDIVSEITLGVESSKMMVQFTFSGYKAVDVREDIANVGSVTEFLEKRLSGTQAIWNLDSVSCDDLTDLSKPLRIRGFFSAIERFDPTGLNYTKVFAEKTVPNPFRSQYRVLPIEFLAPIERTETVVIKFPEGYSVKELPASETIVLPNKKGVFIMNFFDNGNELTAQRTFIISNPFFFPQEYAKLKNLFDRSSASSNSTVVIQKI